MTALLEQFATAGLWPGLGSSLAGQLTQAGIAGPDDVTTERLRALPGVGVKRAERLATAFAQAAPAYAVAALLAQAGLPLRLAGGVVETLGEGCATRLRENPWRLLDSGDAKPEQADTLARALLERPTRADPRRGAAFTAHLLARAGRDGHTALPVRTIAAALDGLDVPDPVAAVQAAVADGSVVHFADEQVVSLTRYAEAEGSIAEGIIRLRKTSKPLCPPDAVGAVIEGLDDAQAAAVRAVAAHGVSILTGGPGTGKSRTVAAVVALARRQRLRVALAAPTGRAAKRLEELTEEPSSTLHRLLGAQGTTGEFARGEHWPLDADVVVVDETSMVDVELAAALLAACADGVHLMLVGDPAQLPSIGPGRVLGDLLDSAAVPVTELTTLHRQAEGGTIARLATAVRAGELPPVQDPTREVVVVPAGASEQAATRAVQLVTDSIPRVLGITAPNVQVVTPVHRGPAGTIALNAALKAVLNPGAGALGGFDVGDRVVATANHVDEGFANGEVGTVIAIEDGALVVAFEAGPVTVPARYLGDLRHGFAVTVHRAQGSEWPAVVAVLPGEAGGLLSRPLVYTAFTRAERHLSIVHAAGPALARAVRLVGARPRRTRLRRLLANGG